MNYQLLTLAGILGMMISLVHGYLGFRLVLSQIENVPKTIKLVNELVFHLSTLYWLCGGLMLVLLPLFPNDESRKVAALVVAFLTLLAHSLILLQLRGAISGGWCSQLSQ